MDFNPKQKVKNGGCEHIRDFMSLFLKIFTPIYRREI